ncbi:hypothetical protein RvY_17244 [Ramazzottius varieornatus]|uniref:Uncharacterized protein n=1 Tax=Ramazzottius varieornatus TaxID=947166 RepID=A0A1D1W1I2_RAMVA|nr:hypothetical protein RvY_17244 [Ramazzottius varieornatus]
MPLKNSHGAGKFKCDKQLGNGNAGSNITTQPACSPCAYAAPIEPLRSGYRIRSDKPTRLQADGHMTGSIYEHQLFVTLSIAQRHG